MDSQAQPVFEIEEAAAPGPLVFASPHSGDRYPQDMQPRAGLPDRSLTSAEDALVDRLVATGPSQGAALIRARIGRGYVDLNRPPDALDPLLIEGVEATTCPKTRAGYGVVARLTGDGQDLYDRRLTRAEVEARLAYAHAPYHGALAGLMQAALGRHGRAVLVDWHSMPGTTGPDVVLGDRHGASCGARLTRRMRALFEQCGWTVALNHPYAGGWCTETWGRPDDGYEAIQVEIRRGLYLDPVGGGPGHGFERRRKDVARVIAGLCAERWDR
ncbi:MAG: N-formylglutamate amidohydrolase [Brevundimonas sp.]|nr:MAG: N-formylglutamate amidohydrolase [Brevundimonas sp.]